MFKDKISWTPDNVMIHDLNPRLTRRVGRLFSNLMVLWSVLVELDAYIIVSAPKFEAIWLPFYFIRLFYSGQRCMGDCEIEGWNQALICDQGKFSLGKRSNTTSRRWARWGVRTHPASNKMDAVSGARSQCNTTEMECDALLIVLESFFQGKCSKLQIEVVG